MQWKTAKERRPASIIHVSLGWRQHAFRDGSACCCLPTDRCYIIVFGIVTESAVSITHACTVWALSRYSAWIFYDRDYRLSLSGWLPFATSRSEREGTRYSAEI